jgi:hypothetical protein
MLHARQHARAVACIDLGGTACVPWPSPDLDPQPMPTLAPQTPSQDDEDEDDEDEGPSLKRKRGKDEEDEEDEGGWTRSGLGREALGGWREAGRRQRVLWRILCGPSINPWSVNSHLCQLTNPPIKTVTDDDEEDDE